MRVAIVSDIHGNLTAFEAVLADLRDTSPDLILHGGDLADNGSGGAEIVDAVRSLRWEGCGGNTDEMLASPSTFEAFAARAPQLGSIWAAAREMGEFSRAALGEERLAWLGALPPTVEEGTVVVLHASPSNCWESPTAQSSDAELEATYGTAKVTTVFGHIHTPFVRELSGGRVVANAGSVGLPYDGDCRASYLVLDDSEVTIRRVGYDIDKEVKRLSSSGLPHWEWIARTLQAATPQMP